MARVCQDWFPETDGFYMDDRLIMQLEVILRNVKNDWDFTILVTGQGEVRVGKSMIAMQIGAYWSYEVKKRYGIDVPFNLEDNFVFDGKKLIEKGNKLGQNTKYACLIFDEAGADLEGRKAIQVQTQDVLDYYRECGQYNMLNVLVIPEFFDLPKGLALSRSIFLIDVFYSVNQEAIFQRGYFNFYSRRSKKLLYMFGKKELNYSVIKSDFGKIPGRFHKFFPIEEKAYRDAKYFALKKREGRKKDMITLGRNSAWYILSSEYGMTYEKIAQRMTNLIGKYVAKETVRDAIANYLDYNHKITGTEPPKGEGD